MRALRGVGRDGTSSSAFVALDGASAALDAGAAAYAVCLGGPGMLAMLLSMSRMGEKFASDRRCARTLGISAREHRDIPTCRGPEIDALARGLAAALAERDELA